MREPPHIVSQKKPLLVKYMVIPNKYDRLCIEYYILVGQATYSCDRRASRQHAGSNYGSLALGESLTSLMTEHAHSRNVDLYM